MRRFFAKAVKVVEADNEVLAETLRRALPNFVSYRDRAWHACWHGVVNRRGDFSLMDELQLYVNCPQTVAP